MEGSNKISEYLKNVCEQIRWKKAHRVISKELEDHIVDQKDAFISQGMEEDAAIEKAIQEMGDPIIVGSELDRTHKPKPQWSLIFLTGVLLILGVIIREFIAYDSGVMGRTGGNIVLMVFGIGAMALAYFLDYTIIGKYPRFIYFTLIAITIGVLAMSPRYMAQSYYPKFLMLLFPTAFAGIIYNMKNKGYIGIILSGIYFIFPALICLQIPSLSSLALYSITCLIILTYAILKDTFNVKKLNAMLLVYIPTIITPFILFKFAVTYQIERLKAALNPSLDPLGWGWMANLTRNIIANAKFIGQSQFGIEIYGVEPEKLLPNINTDFLLTYLIDRLGWISFIVIMAILCVFIVRSFKFTIKQKNVLGGLISTSIIINFIMQVLIYVVNNLGFQLIAPLSLPLISYGRIATFINMFLIGIMLSVFRYSTLYSSKESTSMVSKKTFNFVDGKIIIDLNR